jgi:hypothetical protein
MQREMTTTQQAIQAVTLHRKDSMKKKRNQGIAGIRGDMRRVA